MIRILILLMLFCTSAMAQYRLDILGEGFEQRTIDLPNEDDGDLCATLVRTLPVVESPTAILYIHGYNDYFFQEAMARRLNDSMYNFYALDLRRYGRSLSSENMAFQVEELYNYFDEISQAINIVREESSADEVILMGHSTGGLIASLYACEQEDMSLPRVDGLILNSPFLDMNLSPIMENIVLPIASALGRYMSLLELSTDSSTAYFESLDSAHQGEWAYDTELKMPSGIPTTAGWLRAIHLAQKRVQSNPDIHIPILLMHSDKSVISSEWVPEYQTSDSVLDVDDMAKYGKALGDHVTHVIIPDGMHDLILSGREAREATYSAIFKWLNPESH